MDSTYLLGIGLIVAGIVIFLFGRFRTDKTTVSASHGSVAIGGKSTGNIKNINIGQQPAARAGGHGGHTVTIIAILVELVGIGVTIWHAMHLAAK